MKFKNFQVVNYKDGTPRAVLSKIPGCLEPGRLECSVKLLAPADVPHKAGLLSVQLKPCLLAHPPDHLCKSIARFKLFHLSLVTVPHLQGQIKG